MKYKGYIARVEFDDKDRLFVGHLAGIRDIVGFHGVTVDELESAFHESVDRYISISQESGRPAQKPCSGKILLRVPPEVHQAALGAAVASGVSLNQWATGALRKAAGV